MHVRQYLSLYVGLVLNVDNDFLGNIRANNHAWRLHNDVTEPCLVYEQARITIDDAVFACKSDRGEECEIKYDNRVS